MTISLTQDLSENLLAKLEVQTVKEEGQEHFNKHIQGSPEANKSAEEAHLDQVITYEGQSVALLRWGACIPRVKIRDQWIGWSQECAKERKNLVVRLQRIKVLGKERKPNLEARALQLGTSHLADEWEKQYGYMPALVEAYADPEPIDNTRYQLNKWKALGIEPQYNRHEANYYIDEKQPKKLWIKRLHPQGTYWLRGPENHIPKRCRKGLNKDTSSRKPSLEIEQIKSLYKHFQQMPDPRSQNRKFKIESLLMILSMGMLCGYNELTQMQRLGTLLTEQQCRIIGLPLKKDSSKEYVVPSYNAFYNLLKKIDLKEMADHLNCWLEAQSGTLPKTLAFDGKSLRDRIHVVSLVEQETGNPIAMTITPDKGHEMKEAQHMLEKIDDLSNTLITADALHCQKKRSNYLLNAEQIV